MDLVGMEDLMINLWVEVRATIQFVVRETEWDPG